MPMATPRSLTGNRGKGGGAAAGPGERDTPDGAIEQPALHQPVALWTDRSEPAARALYAQMAGTGARAWPGTTLLQSGNSSRRMLPRACRARYGRICGGLRVQEEGDG